MSHLSFLRFLAGLGGSLMLCALAAPLLAAPADDIRTRVAGLRELGAAFKAVNDGLRGADVQIMLIQISARQIRNAAADQYHWFPAGSGPAPGVKTAAKPEIWTKPAEFRAAQDQLARAADGLQAAAASGNVDTIRTAVDASAAAGRSTASCPLACWSRSFSTPAGSSSPSAT